MKNHFLVRFYSIIVIFSMSIGAVGMPTQSAQAAPTEGSSPASGIPSELANPNALGKGTVAPVQMLAPDCINPPNEIVAENCKIGNPSSEWDIAGAGDSTIQGFATDISVNRGGTISFKVDTVATSFQIKIYRLGYYNGLGARLIDTMPNTATIATAQPACTNSGSPDYQVDCGGWSVSATWTAIDPTYDPDINAISGLYIARLERTDGTSGASHIPFIVRDDSGNSDLLFQTSDTTWQAYNGYGDYSLYANSQHAHKVSYNRPFTTRANPTEDNLFNAEYPMIRWLERNGYDVSYFTDVDSDRYGPEIKEHKVFMSVGHDEYWSAGQRAAVEAARDTGVNLAFFSGNEIYWKTRWENNYRTLVSYKEGDAQGSEHYNCQYNFDCDPDPTVWTGLWRQNQTGHDGGRPENALSGQISWGDATTAIQVPASLIGLRFWRNAGMTGDTTLSANTLGYEFDWEQPAYASSNPPGRITLSDTTAVGKNHKISLYRAPSGALVFGVGTVQWSWGLDGIHDRGSSTEDPRMQQATVNLFADMGVQPGSLQTGVVAATASTDTTGPTTTITSPANGVTVPGGNVTITGTAADTGGGLVASVEVSTNGGTTWTRATGTTSWTYMITSVSQSVTVQARSIDDSVNIGAANSITFTAEAQTCPCSIFTLSTTGVQDSDSSSVELGVKLRSDVDGYITGIRFYKTSGNTGTHLGNLWSTTGVNLATVTFSSETVSGWQEMLFDSPVAISANTTYIASYYAPVGKYATGASFASAGVDNPPLHALGEGVDGSNGIYLIAAGGGYPTATYQSSNYLVDVVFTTSVGQDTTPPHINSVAPTNNAINVSTSTNINATFNEPLDAATVNEATIELRDPLNALVPGVVTYNNATRTATLDPISVLENSKTYTAKVIGGTGANVVKDAAGNKLVADYSWSFTTSAPPPLPPNEGPGGPILVIADSSSTSNPFGRYYAEILRAEGFNAYFVMDISNVSSATLADYDVVLLGEMPLSSTQITMFDNWVSGGGSLIAFRPDKSLAAQYGLAVASGTTAEGYLAVNTSTAIGQGVVGDTLQFHGSADHYTLSGATSLATLYTNATTATTYPAIVRYTRGSGQVAIFTFDLARSIVLMRQGNPAWAGVEGDGTTGIRASDMFVGRSGQPNWIDNSKLLIPQADEQMHVLSHAIEQLNAAKSPLPRLWYFPDRIKGALIMTGDSEGCSGSCVNTVMQDVNNHGGTYSAYLLGTQPTLTEVSGWLAAGNDVAPHYDDTAEAGSPTYANMNAVYDTMTQNHVNAYGVAPRTVRNHWIVWTGWADQAKIEAAHGIGLDTNYYHWGSWLGGPGFFTGSGLPLRFADENGNILDIFQSTTQLPDETWYQNIASTFKTLIDRSIDQGYYGFFNANFHPPNYGTYQTVSGTMMDYANSRGVPIWSAEKLLDFLQARNQARTNNIHWDGSKLTFDFTALTPYTGLTLMIPARAGGKNLSSLSSDGNSVLSIRETIKGYEYALFTASSGSSYTALYELDTTVPTVTAVTPTAGATGIALNAAITTTFSEAIDPATLSAVNFSLLDPGSNAVAATVSYNTTNQVATLTPITTMTPSTQYTAKLKGGSGGVSDEAGNPLTTDFTWSFTTNASAYNCPCSIYGNTGGAATWEDATTYDLGVKFKSIAAGEISGIRFYRGETTGGPFVGKLWSSGGVLLGTTPSHSVSTVGWQDVLFTTPVPIEAGTTYVASYYTPNGRYSYTGGSFGTEVQNPPLVALATGGTTGSNGVYKAGGGFPDQGSGGANFWVDVIFDTVHTASPIISTIDATPGTGGTATVTWTTNELATSRVDYGTAPDALTQNVIDSTLVTSHSLPLMGLTSETTYYYRVTSVDAATNSSTSPTVPAAPLSFTTPAPDTAAPVISIVNAAPGPNRTATITWSTDELSTSRVDYGISSSNLSLNTSVPAFVTAHSLALSGLLPNTIYYYRVTSVDASSNSAASPASPETATFTTPSSTFADTTAIDFSTGTLNSCVVDATIGDGAIRLGAAFDESFSGTGLPTNWSSYVWSGSTPTISGGSLIINGVSARNDTLYGPGRTLEFVATFNADAYQHVGFGANEPTFNAGPWIMFSTGRDTPPTQLYARVVTSAAGPYNTGDDMIGLGSQYLGSSHLYRIDWNTDSVVLSIDGVQVVTRNVTISDPMRVASSDYFNNGISLTVDWIRMSPPYISPCTFTSRVFDASEPVNWDTLIWTGSIPTDTALNLRYRIGSTSSLDGVQWIALNGNSPRPLSGNSRYIQYQAELSSASTTQTPNLQDVTIAYHTGADTIAPTISNVNAVPNGSGSAVITWDTDEPSDSWVQYGTTPGALNLSTNSTNLVTAHTITLTSLAANTTYYYRVTSKDPSNNSKTSPGTGNSPASFTMPAVTYTLTDTTTTDFTAGSTTCAIDTTIGDGAVRLPGTIEENFSGAALHGGWTSLLWSNGLPGGSTLSGGSVSVDSARLTPTSLTGYAPTATVPVVIEFVATFGAAQYQNAGLGAGDNTTGASGMYATGTQPWAMFGIPTATSNQLYARLNPGGDIAIGSPGAYTSSPHRYRIEWRTGNDVEFFIDGVSVNRRTASFGPITMRPGISDYNSGGPDLTVDWLQVTPYTSPCTFTSRVIDTSGAAIWDTLAWTGSTPTGTSLSFSYRIGNTSIPDASWSAFAPVASSTTAITGTGRYLQYQVILTTSDSGKTPVLESVTFTYHAAPTAVTLNSFSVGKSATGVQLGWVTDSDTSTAGFNLYRREASGSFNKVNDSLIPTQLGGQPMSSVYTYLDQGAQPGRLYVYRLEVVDTNLTVSASSQLTFWPYVVMLPLLVH